MPLLWVTLFIPLQPCLSQYLTLALYVLAILNPICSSGKQCSFLHIYFLYLQRHTPPAPSPMHTFLPDYASALSA